jgi:hypothetical protein
MDEANQTTLSPTTQAANPTKCGPTKDLIMKTFIATAALLSTALFAAVPAHADASYDTYRRVVLGDSSIAAPAPAAAGRTELVAGPVAQHLIYAGASKTDAIATAARIGERANYRNVAASGSQVQLTPAQAYAKYLGNDGFAARSNESVGSAE